MESNVLSWQNTAWNPKCSGTHINLSSCKGKEEQKRRGKWQRKRVGALEAGLSRRETCSPGKKRGKVPAGAVGSGRPIHHAVPTGIREGHAHTIAVCSGLPDGEENVTCPFRYKQLIHTPLLSFSLSISLFPSCTWPFFFFFFQEKQMKNSSDAEQAIFPSPSVSLK